MAIMVQQKDHSNHRNKSCATTMKKGMMMQPLQDQHQKRRKQVSFANEDRDEIHIVERLSKDLWYTRADELQRKHSDRYLIQKRRNFRGQEQCMKEEERHHNNECLRGLEYYYQDEVHRSIYLRRKSTLIAVLNTQDRCRKNGQDTATGIYRAYSMVSKTASLHAIGVAIADERFVQDRVRDEKDDGSEQPQESSIERKQVQMGRNDTVVDENDEDVNSDDLCYGMVNWGITTTTTRTQRPMKPMMMTIALPSSSRMSSTATTTTAKFSTSTSRRRPTAFNNTSTNSFRNIM